MFVKALTVNRIVLESGVLVPAKLSVADELLALVRLLLGILLQPPDLALLLLDFVPEAVLLLLGSLQLLVRGLEEIVIVNVVSSHEIL